MSPAGFTSSPSRSSVCVWIQSRMSPSWLETHVARELGAERRRQAAATRASRSLIDAGTAESGRSRFSRWHVRPVDHADAPATIAGAQQCAEIRHHASFSLPLPSSPDRARGNGMCACGRSHHISRSRCQWLVARELVGEGRSAFSARPAPWDSRRSTKSRMPKASPPSRRRSGRTRARGTSARRTSARDTGTTPRRGRSTTSVRCCEGAQSCGAKMIVGSAGGAGLDQAVDRYFEIARADGSAVTGLAKVRVARIYSELSLDWLRTRVDRASTARRPVAVDS